VQDTKSNFLDDYQLEAEFAVEIDVCQRTVARYRGEPNGLPFVELGGRIYIHIPSARDWLAGRLKRNNPRRAA
jgi:hypothetical protein